MKTSLLSFLAALLLFCILSPMINAQEVYVRPRLITVTGTAEVKVAPDEAILTLGVEAEGKDLLAAKSEHDSRVKKVIALAHDFGIEPKDIQTDTLRMEANYSEGKTSRLIGYTVSQVLEITLRDLSKYESLITQLLQDGANRVHGVDFVASETRKYMDEARTKAIRAAKEKAVSMAAELGQTVGKPWEISEQGAQNCYGGMLPNASVNSMSRARTESAEE